MTRLAVGVLVGLLLAGFLWKGSRVAYFVTLVLAGLGVLGGVIRIGGGFAGTPSVEGVSTWITTVFLAVVFVLLLTGSSRRFFLRRST
jgi:hypothetical protein